MCSTRESLGELEATKNPRLWLFSQSETRNMFFVRFAGEREMHGKRHELPSVIINLGFKIDLEFTPHRLD